MQLKSVRLAAAAMILAALVVSGCGGASTAPVSGTITLDGEPVGPGSIIFLPVSEEATRPSAMTTFGHDGRYELAEGAAVGTHQVIIQGQRGGEGYGREGPATPSPIPLLYADPAASGLSAEVRNGSNQLDFDLEGSRAAAGSDYQPVGNLQQLR